MEVFFRSKEESNRAQEEAFLALSPIERIYSYLRLMQRVKEFPTKAPKKKNNNFVIEIHTKK